MVASGVGWYAVTMAPSVTLAQDGWFGEGDEKIAGENTNTSPCLLQLRELTMWITGTVN